MKKHFLLAVLLFVASPAYGQVDLGTSASSTNPQRSGDATTGLFSSTSDAVSVSSGGTEIMRVNGTGVGIGTTNLTDLLTLYTQTDGTLIRAVTDGLGGGLDLDSYASPGNSGYFGRCARGTFASPQAVQVGDRLGMLIFSGYSGTNGFYNTAALQGFVDAGTISNTSLPSYLTLETTPNGQVTRYERMRVTENGYIGIGTTSPTTLLHVAGIARANQVIIGETTDTYNGSIEITYNDANNYGIFFVDTNTGTPNAPALEFERNGGAVGSITLTNTNTAYNTSSDRRLKENITDTISGLEQLMQISVHDFNFISDPKKAREQGFIAQELYKIYPEAVTPGGDDPKKKPWGIDYGRLTPLLLKAIQEQQKEIDALKRELKKLEK